MSVSVCVGTGKRTMNDLPFVFAPALAFVLSLAYFAAVFSFK